MEFRTRIVVSRRNKRAVIAYAGLFVALSSLIIAFIPGMQDYIPWVFGIGIAIVVIGALIARGDVRSYGLSEEILQVGINGIAIGSEYYPMNQIRNLDFNVEGYAGRVVDDNAMPVGATSDGMTNEVSFSFGGKKISCGFYLQNMQHVYELGEIFEAYYRGHVPFVEHNRSTRTYLFRYLSEEELVEFKKKYGYS